MIFKERQSIYLQIADRISDEILAGTYAPGARVPSVREYAVMIEVNLNTVMRPDHPGAPPRGLHLNAGRRILRDRPYPWRHSR